MSEERNVKLFTQDVFDANDKINLYVLGMTDEKQLKKERSTRIKRNYFKD